MEIAERDRKNESTNFQKYVTSFVGLDQCRPSLVQKKMRNVEEEALGVVAAKVYAKTGSPNPCRRDLKLKGVP